MTTFSKLWDAEVKQLAQACVPVPELIQLLDEDHELTDNEKEYLEEMCKKYKDIRCMYYISGMIWDVEHALANLRLYRARMSIFEICSVLDDPDYFQEIFKGDEDDEEWKKLVALRDGLHKLLKIEEL